MKRQASLFDVFRQPDRAELARSNDVKLHGAGINRKAAAERGNSGAGPTPCGWPLELPLWFYIYIPMPAAALVLYMNRGVAENAYDYRIYRPIGFTVC
jgi:hypothetical protein